MMLAIILLAAGLVTTLIVVSQMERRLNRAADRIEILRNSVKLLDHDPVYRIWRFTPVGGYWREYDLDDVISKILDKMNLKVVERGGIDLVEKEGVNPE